MAGFIDDMKAKMKGVRDGRKKALDEDIEAQEQGNPAPNRKTSGKTKRNKTIADAVEDGLETGSKAKREY